MNPKQQTSKHNHEFLSVIGLLIVTALWGFGFISLKLCEAIPPFLLIGIRFGIATAVLSIAFPKKLKLITKDLVVVAFFAGICIFICYAFATIGIRYTTASRNAFFTCLEALFVPILSFLIFRTKPERKFIFCVILCIIGIFFISMGSTSDMGLASGDIISLGASVSFAVELIILGRFGSKHDPITLTIVQMFFVSISSFILMLIMGETIPSDISVDIIAHVLYLGVGASGIAFVLQTICLKHIESHRGALILTTEPVLGAIFCAIFLNDYLGLRGYIGGALVFLSIFLSEANVGDFFKKGRT